MYYHLTRDFLERRSKPFIKWLSSMKAIPLSSMTSSLIADMLKDETGQLGRKAHLLFCEFCRQYGLLSTTIPEDPIFCVFCGEASPIDSFRINISRAERLFILASYAETDEETRNLLSEQIIVMIVTSLEVLFRKVYAIHQDCKHVIYGEPILSQVYEDTRNEFLNFGVTNGKYKRDIGINIKSIIGQSNFRQFSSIYSKRHVIIHNASNIDNDYIGQTGCSRNLLNTHISISTAEVRDALSKVDEIVEILRPVLTNAIINLIEGRVTMLPPKALTKTYKKKRPAP